MCLVKATCIDQLIIVIVWWVKCMNELDLKYPLLASYLDSLKAIALFMWIKRSLEVFLWPGKFNFFPFGHSLWVTSVTDELWISPERPITLRVTKRANGMLYFASGCHTPQCGYRGSRCTALIHLFASVSSVGVSLLFSCPAIEKASEWGRDWQLVAVVTVSWEERKDCSPCKQPHQECAVASSSVCFSV